MDYSPQLLALIMALCIFAGMAIGMLLEKLNYRTEIHDRQRA